MATEYMPINPAIVSWGLKKAGLSVDDAAKNFARIAEWESGKSSPTYTQLEQLAESLKLPVAVFFFPDPPDVPDIEETFRTLPGGEFERLPSKIRLLLRKAKAQQISLYELTDGRNPFDKLITRDLKFDLKTPIDKIAKVVRKYLNVSSIRST
jgi:transcriptional regulator with XRE-family HTH domain